MAKDLNHKKLGRQKKKHQHLCLGLQMLGLLIIAGSLFEIGIALGFDVISEAYTLHYEPGIGIRQILIACLGGFGALIGLFLFALGKYAK